MITANHSGPVLERFAFVAVGTLLERHMTAIVRSVAAVSVAIVASTAVAHAQARVNRNTPNPTTAAALAAVVSMPTWKPAGAPIVLSLPPGDRIVIKYSNPEKGGMVQDAGGDYFMLENSAGAVSSRPLHRQCVSVSQGQNACTYKLGPAQALPSGAVLQALINLAPNANTSEIVTLQEIGTLAVAPNGSPGLQQTTLGKGQSLVLANNQTLALTTQGWGARYYVLMANGQQIGKWPAERLFIDGTLRVRLAHSLGWHRYDNWGILKQTLMQLQ